MTSTHLYCPWKAVKSCLAALEFMVWELLLHLCASAFASSLLMWSSMMKRRDPCGEASLCWLKASALTCILSEVMTANVHESGREWKTRGAEPRLHTSGRSHSDFPLIRQQTQLWSFGFVWKHRVWGEDDWRTDRRRRGLSGIGIDMERWREDGGSPHVVVIRCSVLEGDPR